MKNKSINSQSFSLCIKRAFDVVFAAVGLLLTLPIIVIATVQIRFSSPGPIFFRQKRLGLDGSIFNIFKFRTMIDYAWLKGDGLRVTNRDPRITTAGNFLRKLHIDELPQLINVLLGNMSIVGPRPALPFHYDYYEEWEKKRVSMRPGITGWAQINGANAIDWNRRIEMDVWYVENWSLWLDLKIILLTIWHLIMRILGKKDVYATTDMKLWTRGFPDDYFTNSLYNERCSNNEKKEKH